MNRRFFLGTLALLPIIGRFFRPFAPASGVISMSYKGQQVIDGLGACHVWELPPDCVTWKSFNVKLHDAPPPLYFCGASDEPVSSCQFYREPDAPRCD